MDKDIITNVYPICTYDMYNGSSGSNTPQGGDVYGLVGPVNRYIPAPKPGQNTMNHEC